MVRVHPSRIAVSESHSYSALIYDLAPWDDRALVRINRLRRWRPELPILFYVPPVSRAVALIPRCGGIGNVRFRMQEHSGNGMSEFRRDVAWLVQSLPSGEIITRLREAFPEMPSSLLQLARYVLRTPGCQPATHGRVGGPSPEAVQTDARAAGEVRRSTRPQGINRLDHAASRVFRSIAGFNLYIEGGTLCGSQRKRSLPNQESTGRPSRKATPEPGEG